MGTVLEGDWDTVFGVVRKCYERMSQDCSRISVSIKVDARKNQENRLDAKVKSLEKRLGKPLQKS
jgi:uncharacterized protein (TIGR00106 family)